MLASSEYYKKDHSSIIVNDSSEKLLLNKFIGAERLLDIQTFKNYIKAFSLGASLQKNLVGKYLKCIIIHTNI